LDQWKIHAVETAHAETDQEAKHTQQEPVSFWNKRQCAGRQGEVQNRGDKDPSSPDPVCYVTPQEPSDYRTQTGREYEEGGLEIGQLPRHDDDAQDKAEKEEVEELQHVGQDRGYQNAVLAFRHRCFIYLLKGRHVAHGFLLSCVSSEITRESSSRQGRVRRGPASLLRGR
jgi:hypothetical protein